MTCTASYARMAALRLFSPNSAAMLSKSLSLSTRPVTLAKAPSMAVLGMLRPSSSMHMPVASTMATFPAWVTTVFGKSPVVLATLVAVLLNVVLPKSKETK